MKNVKHTGLTETKALDIHKSKGLHKYSSIPQQIIPSQLQLKVHIFTGIVVQIHIYDSSFGTGMNWHITHKHSKKSVPTFVGRPNRPDLGPPEKYPGSLEELTRAEVIMLTQILHLDNTTQSSYTVRILKFVLALPKRLRRSRLNQSPQLCGVHHLINPEVTTDLFHLVQREVTVHFHPFDAHPEEIPPFETKTLADLRALKGMWTPPSTIPVPPGAWRYQVNKCPGCMLARVASKKETLRDLRVVLWSRADEYNKHSLHRLMAFVDDCIVQFGDDEAEEIFATVINLAHEMKVVRRACINASSGEFDRQQSRGTGRAPYPIHSFSRHETGRLGRSEHSPTSHQLYCRPPKADNESDEGWGDLPQKIDDMIGIYNEFSRRSPCKRREIVPEAMVASLHIQDKMLWTNRKSKRDGIVGFPSE